jgi:hydrogenase maturation protein HypF
MRPFVLNLARSSRLTGWVRNDSTGVTIEVQGDSGSVDNFYESLRLQGPALARYDALDTSQIPTQHETEFVILESRIEPEQSGPVAADIATCEACLRELRDPDDRRFGYPFINCTQCGPRFTIIEAVPYDRQRTTMKSFTMCVACAREYQDPTDRRFHAQPNACHQCGPQLWLVEQGTSADSFVAPPTTGAGVGAKALVRFAELIQAGAIVAVKGIGGFHLACDATNERAVNGLRQRKGRMEKPLAMMVGDMETAGQWCDLEIEHLRALTSPQRPIVLLRKKKGSRALPWLAPGQNYLGLMLPYAPLHHLLLAAGPPLVMTSANLSEEPIVRGNVEAHQRLHSVADAYLLHDREIHVACDDSVLRGLHKGVLPIRRSRGYAPLPIQLNGSGPELLAMGGELKSTCCVTHGQNAYLSAHQGDMGELLTLEAMGRNVEHLLGLFRITPQAIVADLHPGYVSTQWAQARAAAWGIPCIRVQHHQAHIAALMAEHRLPLDSPIIGCCFDGTGYGTDGTLWGGEFFVGPPRQASAQGMVGTGRNAGAGTRNVSNPFQRFAHLRSVRLPGGDALMRRPYRIALAVLHAAGIAWHPQLPCVATCEPRELQLTLKQLERNINCVASSSMGRLFDAVAAILGVRQRINFEAQAAVELESLAEEFSLNALLSCSSELPELPEDLHFEILETSPLTIDAAHLTRYLCQSVLAGVPPARLAADFHLAVAHMVVDVCRCAQRQHGISLVGLTGGVFQNALLLHWTTSKLEAAGFEVLCHRQVPPNDAGLALGQTLLARAMMC